MFSKDIIDDLKTDLIKSCSNIIVVGVDKIVEDINNFIDLVKSYDDEYNTEEIIKKYIYYKVEKLLKNIKLSFDIKDDES